MAKKSAKVPRRVIITVPDELSTQEISNYVRLVAMQIEWGNTSGQISVDQYWESEGRLK